MGFNLKLMIEELRNILQSGDEDKVQKALEVLLWNENYAKSCGKL
jgi:hypothetical protein